VKLVYVKWEDAHAAGMGWIDVDDVDTEPVIVHTAGWLAAQNSARIVLVQTTATCNDETQIINSHTIPKGMVLEMKTIEGFDV